MLLLDEQREGQIAAKSMANKYVAAFKLRCRTINAMLHMLIFLDITNHMPAAQTSACPPSAAADVNAGWAANLDMSAEMPGSEARTAPSMTDADIWPSHHATQCRVCNGRQASSAGGLRHGQAKPAPLY
jgi:hypothetical protein